MLLVLRLLENKVLQQVQPLLLLFGLLLLVSNHGKQVESNLRALIFLDPLLDLLSRSSQPSILGHISMYDRALLQAIELVELSIVVNVANEVEGIVVSLRILVLLDLEGVLASEAIVG